SKLLAEAVRELAGHSTAAPVDPVISVAVEGFLSDEYVPEVNQRLALYKRLAGAASEAEVADLRAELADRFGPLPAAAEQLLDIAGCSVPQWMPLIGEKPTKDEPPKAAPATSAVPVRLSTVSKTSTPDDRVTDRVLAIVNNDAITLSELQEAIAVYRYENRDRANENSDQLIQQFLTLMLVSRPQAHTADRE